MDDLILTKRLGLIEEQLRVISEHLGIAAPPFASTLSPSEGSTPMESTESGVPAEVVELARAGHTTQAISLLRKLTGATLLEAKNAVDAL